ncbi:MAG: chorismate mutase [Microthrixaceae bacterium]
MTMNVQALRGATTLELDESEHLLARVEELLGEMIDRNGLQNGDLVSILFTATPDIHSVFPAVAARRMGYGDVPLMCAQELDIAGAMPLCVRIMMHINTDLARNDLRHVYLEQARSLRDDLPE